MDKKTIDINQRIPLDTLYAVLNAYLDGNCTKDYILEQLRLEYKGENRLLKALRITNKIIPKNPIINKIDKNRTAVKLAIKNKADRDIILISLLNSAFPFSYNVLSIFGRFFAVQEIINSDTIKKAVANIYGGNRATENGIYSVVPMFLEANLFKRPKLGVYQSKNRIMVKSEIATILFLESFKINNDLNEIQEYQLMNPYFHFIDNN